LRIAAAAVYVLGVSGTYFLLIDRILVSEAFGGGCGEESFLTTRVGDVFFLLGIVWLFSADRDAAVLSTAARVRWNRMRCWDC
jgi:NADH:ubiquinone oxidoreductase subunit 5 (subunit L)/multisubunit Na+/H+ antiporter MnhA subunit